MEEALDLSFDRLLMMMMMIYIYSSANIIWVIESRGGQWHDVWQEMREKNNASQNLQRGAGDTQSITIKITSKMSIMVTNV